MQLLLIGAMCAISSIQLRVRKLQSIWLASGFLHVFNLPFAALPGQWPLRPLTTVASFSSSPRLYAQNSAASPNTPAPRAPRPCTVIRPAASSVALAAASLAELAAELMAEVALASASLALDEREETTEDADSATEPVLLAEALLLLPVLVEVAVELLAQPAAVGFLKEMY